VLKQSEVFSTEAKSLLVHLFGFTAFPKDPEIQFSGPLEVGKPVTVKCLAPDIYPVYRLEIDLFKGDQLMNRQEFSSEEMTKSLETKSLEVTFTPVIEDIGKALVCRAKLHIDQIDSTLKERETVKELQVYSKYLLSDLWSVGVWSWTCIMLFIVTINVNE
jgi:hypothetical protein